MVHTFEDKYGFEAANWLCCLIRQRQNGQLMQMVYNRVKEANVLDGQMGRHFSRVVVSQVDPVVCISVIKEASNGDEHKKVKSSLGQFEEGIPNPQEADIQADQVPLDLVELADANTSKEDQKENTCLKKGTNRLKGIFMTANVYLETGFLEDLGIPIPTAALAKVLEGKPLDESTDNATIILDRNNTRRKSGTTLAIEVAHNMHTHPLNLVRQVLTEKLSKIPVKNLSQKMIEVTVIHFLPLKAE